MGRMEASCGEIRSVRLRRRLGDRRAFFEFVTSEGYAIPVLIDLDPSPPHKIRQAQVWEPWRHFKTRSQIRRAVGLLGAEAAFYAAEVTEDGLKTWLGVDEERHHSVASLMKLYLLAGVAHEVAEERRRWEDALELQDADRSMSSGITHRWPSGTQLSIQAVATLMIAESDNTATDMILHALGRDRAEATLRLCGHSYPARTVPYLSTAEMFKLKYHDAGALGRIYRDLDTQQKRAFLERDVRGLEWSDAHIPSSHPKPTYLAEIGWFASARDVAEVLRKLLVIRDGSVTPLAILAVKAQESVPDGLFDYVGVKVGRDAGVLGFAGVAQEGDHWYVLTCIVNDPEREPSQAMLRAVVLGALSCCGRAID